MVPELIGIVSAAQYLLGQNRPFSVISGYVPRGRQDEDRLVEDMIELARQYGDPR